MSADVLEFRARLLPDEMPPVRPSIPTDIIAYADGSWDCSTDTLVNLLYWFEQYGYEFDAACLFDELVRDLCAILRAAALLDQLHALPSGSAYWEYLHTVRKNNFPETKAARERALYPSGAPKL